jgi:hypothetical protein
VKSWNSITFHAFDASPAFPRATLRATSNISRHYHGIIAALSNWLSRYDRKCGLSSFEQSTGKGHGVWKRDLENLFTKVTVFSKIGSLFC